MFIKTEIWTVGRTESGMAALLRLPSSARCVPVYVEPTEAQMILTALAGVNERPPRFPEFFSALCSAMAVAPESVEILKDGSKGQYRAVVHFRGDGTRFSLYSRTPDALAFAVRSGISIFLEDAIPEEDSISVSMAEPEMSFGAQLSRLREELGNRVDEEDYEQAARIRDRIQMIERRMRAEKE